MRRFHRGQRGFTLIEVLVVVAILGVLAAVVIPNVGRFFGKGQEEAAQTELHDVQTGMIALMADKNLSAVTPVTSATNDMDGFPSATNSLTPYLIGLATGNLTKGTYTCTTDGTVTQVSTGF